MKAFIYSILFFLTLSSSYAQEVQNINSAQEQDTTEYKFSITTLDFAKTDTVVPGIMLDLTEKEYSYDKFTLTLAHNLFKSTGSSVEKENPMKTTLYAQMNFRF